MTAVTSRAIHRRSRLPVSVLVLGILLVLLLIGAIQGGVAMVIDPSTPFGMSPDFLESAPVDDYFWAGMFLLGIAIASALTAVGLFFKWQWRWASGIERAVGYRWPWIGAVATGLILLAFELIELFVVPFHPIMHPLLILGSLAIVLLAWAPSTRRHLSAD